MADYEEVVGVVEVPKAAGIEGFLLGIKDILSLPRVQSIHIDARGRIEYKHYVRTGEPYQPLKVSLDSLMPYAVVRNGTVTELADPDYNAAVALGQLFNAAEADHLYPVCLIGGANTRLWKWYEGSTATTLSSRESLFGVPYTADRMVDDGVIILAAAFARGGALIDTQKSYKLVIPTIPSEVRT